MRNLQRSTSGGRLGTKEFHALLNCAFGQSRFDVLNWLVLGGLVGLRPYEVLRLEWTGIQFQTREIRVELAWTKTHRARIIPLAANALEWLKTKLSESRFGTKYQIDGPLRCPDGRLPAIRSVWIVDVGTNYPRLITAHPLESLQS